MLDLKKRVINTAYLPVVVSCVVVGIEAQATDPLTDLQNQLAVSNQQFVTLDQVTTNLKKKMTKQLQTIQEQEDEITNLKQLLLPYAQQRQVDLDESSETDEIINAAKDQLQAIDNQLQESNQKSEAAVNNIEQMMNQFGSNLTQEQKEDIEQAGKALAQVNQGLILKIQELGAALSVNEKDPSQALDRMKDVVQQVKDNLDKAPGGDPNNSISDACTNLINTIQTAANQLNTRKTTMDTLTQELEKLKQQSLEATKDYDTLSDALGDRKLRPAVVSITRSLGVDKEVEILQKIAALTKNGAHSADEILHQLDQIK